MLCAKCGLDKDEYEFSFKNKTLGTKNTVCKSCHRVYVRTHYEKNKEDYIERSRKSLPKYRAQAKKFVLDYLMTHPCVDCGENRTPCLDFDHIHGKNMTIARMVQHARSIESLKAEIALCEVRCSNCHRIRHANERAIFEK